MVHHGEVIENAAITAEKCIFRAHPNARMLVKQAEDRERALTVVDLNHVSDLRTPDIDTQSRALQAHRERSRRLIVLLSNP